MRAELDVSDRQVKVPSRSPLLFGFTQFIQTCAWNRCSEKAVQHHFFPVCEGKDKHKYLPSRVEKHPCKTNCDIHTLQRRMGTAAHTAQTTTCL